MDIGDRIQRAWRAFVRRHVRAQGLQAELESICWDDDFPLYFYVVIGQHEGEPVIEHFEGPILSDYFLGASGDKLVVAIPAHEGMSKNDLLDFDVAEDSQWWDHPDWFDG